MNLFKRKPKNRRFERTHVLDVKVSSMQRRRKWMRRLAILMIGLFALGFGAFVLGRGWVWVLERYVYQNPAFDIHHLDIETDGVLSLEQLRAWAGVKLRDNLMALDLARIKRDLEMVPAIESAAVERVLPHTLRIRVTERVPIARVPLPTPLVAGSNRSGYYTLDAQGYFMFPIEPVQRAVPGATNEHLPVLTGLPLADLRPGWRTELPSVQAALRLIQAFDQSPMVRRVVLAQLDVSVPNVLVATTDPPCEVVFGLNALDAQLRRWSAIYEHALSQGRRPVWLDLSVSNNVPVRWLEAGTTELPTLKTNNPSAKRKKHV